MSQALSIGKELFEIQCSDFTSEEKTSADQTPDRHPICMVSPAQQRGQCFYSVSDFKKVSEFFRSHKTLLLCPFMGFYRYGNSADTFIDFRLALLALVLSIPGVIIAMTFHEFAHAWMADRLGDDTPRRQGRLTLNPFKHMEPIGMLMLLFAGFGWGRPVQINPNNFNRTITLRKGNALVALAGPVMNLILAVIFSIVYALILAFGGTAFMISQTGEIITTIIVYIISMNVGLGVFNLIPLPPLDGSKVLVAILPTNARNWFESHERILYIVFIIIWITPIASLIISPVIRLINTGLLNLIASIVGMLV